MTKAELQAKKRDLLALAAEFPYCMVLDNCLSEVDEYGEYEYLLGVGDEHCERYTSWEELSKVEAKWRMGILPYSLKNRFEPIVKTEKYAEAGEEVLFFVPQHIYAIKRAGEGFATEIWGKPLVEEISQKQERHLGSRPDFKANFSKEEYLHTIHKLQKHIQAGDIYEINLAQKFTSQVEITKPAEVFERLCEISPVPFAAFFRWEGRYVLCASPERFLQFKNQQILSQPIKGTTKRGKTALEDEQNKAYLQSSLKERAENVMIVDLTRNDLHRSSEVGTVEVPHLFQVQTFPTVHQLVSTVWGRAKAELSWAEIVANTFPPGSMTGAPKVRSMQLISQYEPEERGIYAGSIGYISPCDEFDFNVVIRSLIYHKDSQSLHYHVGGAIVLDSVAEAEYEETLLKAEAIRRIWGDF